MIKLGNLLKECIDCERGVDYTHGHDHEASMADGELRDLISNASKLQNLIQPGDELPGWVSSYITLASDYMHSVAEYMAEQRAEMQQEPEQATPGFAIYEDMTEDAGGFQPKPEYVKDPKHPNFFIAKIKYPVGGGGALVALGSKTASGQERDLGGKKALAMGMQIAKELRSKYNLEDSEVADLENGTVEVFAVSDDFINLKASDFYNLLSPKN
tara:strand:- start:370 stop:1011 length:642 start_codon:yes stop_codon:yes gene_type:complete